MKCLTHYKEKIEAELSVANLFDQAPPVYFFLKTIAAAKMQKCSKRAKSMW